MPPWRMKRDYRWRLHMQKAALDQYLQYKLWNELDKEQRAREAISTAKAGEYDTAIKRALTILRESTENSAMNQLSDEAGKLGDESNELHGDRNLGYFKLDQPLRNLPGEIDQLEEALSAKSDSEKKSTLDSVISSTKQKTSGGRRG
jgi:hypothetical protein